MSSHRQSQPRVRRGSSATTRRSDEWRVMAHRCAILNASMTTRPEEGADEPRLDSWKEIASYLGRGIRTVQRWEREEGLPVHRLDHVNAAACTPAVVS